MDLEAEMLRRIRAALTEHDRQCSRPIKVILFNPGNHRLIGWDEVLGLPVLSDPSIEPKRFHLVCGTGQAGFLDGEPVIWDESGCPWAFEDGRDAA